MHVSLYADPTWYVYPVVSVFTLGWMVNRKLKGPILGLMPARPAR